MESEVAESKKSAMIRALQGRNSELVASLLREREALAGANLDRKDLRARLSVSEEACAAAVERGNYLENQRDGLAREVEELRKLTLPAKLKRDTEAKVAARIHVRDLPKQPAERCEDQRPFHIREQEALAYFLVEQGFASRNPQRAAWHRAYHLNKEMMNEGGFTLDEIMAAVQWLSDSLGRKGYSLQATKDYLQMLIETEEGELLRAAQCESEVIARAERQQQKANVGEEKASA